MAVVVQPVGEPRAARRGRRRRSGARQPRSSRGPARRSGPVRRTTGARCRRAPRRRGRRTPGRAATSARAGRQLDLLGSGVHGQRAVEPPHRPQAAQLVGEVLAAGDPDHGAQGREHRRAPSAAGGCPRGRSAAARRPSRRGSAAPRSGASGHPRRRGPTRCRRPRRARPRCGTSARPRRARPSPGRSGPAGSGRGARRARRRSRRCGRWPRAAPRAAAPWWCRAADALRVVITSAAMSLRWSLSASASASRPTCWASWCRQNIASTWACAASTRARARVSLLGGEPDGLGGDGGRVFVGLDRGERDRAGGEQRATRGRRRVVGQGGELLGQQGGGALGVAAAS